MDGKLFFGKKVAETPLKTCEKVAKTLRLANAENGGSAHNGNDDPVQGHR